MWLAHSFVRGERLIHVLHEDPRRLIVAADTILGKCVFVVLHAPAAPASDAAIFEFWEGVDSSIPASLSGLPIIWFMDGNCRVGSVEYTAIGGYVADEQCFGGESHARAAVEVWWCGAYHMARWWEDVAQLHR